MSNQNSLSPSEPSEIHVDEVDIDTIHEAHASQLLAVQPMTDGDWATVMGKIERYRENLAKERYLNE